MKKKFSLVLLLLCLALFDASRQGLAASQSPIPADLLEHLEEEGWEQVQPGVLQRETEDGTVETLGYGAEGLRFKLQELKAHLVFLRKKYAQQPSAELRLAIRAQRAEILRTQEALKKAGTAGRLESSSEALIATGTTCTANYDATVSVLPVTLGTSAKADAYFENGCGYIGEVYAHAYAKALTAAGEIATMTRSDPAPDTPRTGNNVVASAAVSAEGVKDCYSYAYASVTSYDLGITYSQSAIDSTCPQQTTYRGTPFTVPGTIKAADFDNGGEGISYHEVTPSGGSGYRTTGLDMYEDKVTKLEVGEWLEYTIDVGNEGTYSLVAQVGSATAGGSFHVELDGVDVTGPLSVPLTGGMLRWGSAVKKLVRFPPGLHVLRFVVDTEFGGFYSLRVVPAQAPFGGTPRTLPGVIKVVDFDEGGEQIGYHDNSAGCDGSCGYRLADVDRWERYVLRTETSEWMAYTVDVTTTGTYTLTFRVSAEQGGSIFHLEVDGVNVTGPLTMPTTGSWGRFQDVIKTGVSLTAGRKVMRLVMDDGKNLVDSGTFDTITIQP